MAEDILQNINAHIKELILQRAPKEGNYATAIDHFAIYRRERTDLCENCFYNPMVSVIVQGFKRSLIGSEEYCYGEGHCLITSVDIPAVNSVTVASPEHPFLSLALQIDKQLISQLIAELPQLTAIKALPFSGISVKKVERDILSAFLRLMQLLNKPEQISVLAPMVIKEIHYLLLVGPFGQQLRSINIHGTQSNHIATIISWLKNHYKEPMSIDELADKANMSLSTFHRRFKEITTLSPLQYQKQLRLYEARRLMLSENYNASTAGLAVGYESTTQFNREYKRLFGNPPHKDIDRVI